MIPPRSLSSLAATAVLCFSTCLALPHEPTRLAKRGTGSLANFIAGESPIALQGVLNNIGSTGSLSQGASSGIVVARPSTSNPDCKFYPNTTYSTFSFSNPFTCLGLELGIWPKNDKLHMVDVKDHRLAIPISSSFFLIQSTLQPRSRLPTRISYT